MRGTRKRTKSPSIGLCTALLAFAVSSHTATGMEVGAGEALQRAGAPGATLEQTVDGDDRGTLRIVYALAREGDARAQYELAERYADGEGVPNNHRVAALWYRRAADNGHVDAQVQLGQIYESGEGRPRDPERARFWYRRAALRGDDEAQRLLGALHAEGIGILRDPLRALAWYQLSADKGNQDAARRATRIASEMTAAQVAEALRLAGVLEAEIASEPTRVESPDLRPDPPR